MQAPFSMARETVKFVHRCSPTPALGNSKNEEDKEKED